MWSILPEGKGDIDPVGKPLKHKSADLQACGEATYIDDIPKREDEVYLAFVLSTRYQFHQCSRSSFYVRSSQKHKKL